MGQHLNKKKENQEKSVANDVAQRKGVKKPSAQMVDKRKEPLIQRKLQDKINSSPQALQLKSYQETVRNSTQSNQLTQLQAKVNSQSSIDNSSIQFKKGADEGGGKKNNTGLPDTLKSGVENLSGLSMDDVKVHYNSDKPAQLHAHAYAQGSNIHMGPGQEKHLPHEAWHVVQQKQGRVKPTMQMKGKVNINDDSGLEKEADVMGAKALLETTSSSQKELRGENNVTQNVKQLEGGLKRGLRRQKKKTDLLDMDTGISGPTNIDSSSSDYDPSKAIPLNELTTDDIEKINSRNHGGIDKEEGNQRVHKFSNILSEEERPETREKARLDKMKLDYIAERQIKAGTYVPENSPEVTRLLDSGSNGNPEVGDNFLDVRDKIMLVDSWILNLARGTKNGALITGPYSMLSIDKKIEVFKVANVDLNLEDPQSSKKLKQKFTSKIKPWKENVVEWNRFSLAIRKVGGNSAMVSLLSSAHSESVGENPYADTNADLVEKAGGVGMVSTGIGGAVTKLNTNDGVGQVGLAGCLAGVVFSLNNILTVKRDSTDHEISEKIAKDGVKTLSEASNVLINISKGIGEVSLMAQGKAGGVASMGKSIMDGSEGATSSAIQGGAGAVIANIGAITAIVKGTLDIIQGSYEVIDAGKVKAKLEELRTKMASPDFKLACIRAEETQRQRRVMGGTMIASGAAMVAGGVILTAVALTNPIGWILLTAAGLISLSAALWKIYKKGKSAKNFAKHVYNMQFGSDGEEVDDQRLNDWLNSLGYANGEFASFHNEFMHGLGVSIHSAAFGPDGERKDEARELLRAIKLKIKDDKRTPTPTAISKRLRNP